MEYEEADAPETDEGAPKPPKAKRKPPGRKAPRVIVEVDEGADPEREEAPPSTPGSTYVPDGDGAAVQPIFVDFADTAAVGYLRVRRTIPKDPPLGGNIGDMAPDATEEDIRQRAGGGTFEVTACNRAGKPIASKIVRIAGRPKVPEDDGTAAPSGSGGRDRDFAELRGLFENFLRMQADSREREATAESKRRDDREREFREFALLMKQESSQTLAIVSKATGDAAQSTINAVTTLTGKLLDARAADNTGGGSGFGFAEAMQMMQMMQAAQNQGGQMPPWMLMAFMMMQQYAPPPGSLEWYEARGQEPPEHVKKAGYRGGMGGMNPAMMMPMMMMMNGGGMGGINPAMMGMNPAMMGMNPAMMQGMMQGWTPPGIPGPRQPATPAASSPASPEPPPPDEGDDPEGIFLDYLASTPDDVLPDVLASRARDRTIPPRAQAAVDALANGNAALLLALLNEYNSADLLPRLQAAWQEIQRRTGSS